MRDVVASVPAPVLRLSWVLPVVVAVALSPGAASGSIEYYDIVTGERTETFDPEGTDFRSLRPFLVGFRDTSPQIAVAKGGTFRFRNVVTGAHEESRVNFQLEGGDFDGTLLFNVARSEIIGFRDAVGSELALLGPSGIHVYNACGDFFSSGDPCADDGSAEGDLIAVRNARLSGGDFDGSTFSEIPAQAYVGYRDGAASQIAVLGPSGISYYDIVTGEQNGSFDPLLTGGGPFDGRRFSELAPDDFVGFRDLAKSQIALVPEVGPVPGFAAALATLALAAHRCRRLSPRTRSIRAVSSAGPAPISWRLSLRRKSRPLRLGSFPNHAGGSGAEPPSFPAFHRSSCSSGRTLPMEECRRRAW